MALFSYIVIWFQLHKSARGETKSSTKLDYGIDGNVYTQVYRLYYAQKRWM